MKRIIVHTRGRNDVRVIDTAEMTKALVRMEAQRLRTEDLLAAEREQAKLACIDQQMAALDERELIERVKYARKAKRVDYDAKPKRVDNSRWHASLRAHRTGR